MNNRPIIMIAVVAVVMMMGTAAADIDVNGTGWRRGGGAFNESSTPIQAAVTNATVGETICVAAGDYDENVNIGTRHLTLVGADVVTVNALVPGADHVFEVTADYVNISGFTVTGAEYPYAGIYLNGQHCNISDNIASDNDYGIWLDYSSNNTLTSNNASNNYCDGIVLDYSSNNTLTSNIAADNDYGIWLEYSSNNMLTSNTASGNEVGIRLGGDSSNNTLTSNTASDNSDWDIYINDSPSNTFTDNTLNGTTVSFTYSGNVSLKGEGSPAADTSGWHNISKFINATNQSAGAWLYLNLNSE